MVESIHAFLIERALLQEAILIQFIIVVFYYNFTDSKIVGFFFFCFQNYIVLKQKETLKTYQINTVKYLICLVESDTEKRPLATLQNPNLQKIIASSRKWIW